MRDRLPGTLSGAVGADPQRRVVARRVERLDRGAVHLALDDARKQALLRQLNTLEAQEEVQSYLAALRSRYKVDINKAVLDAKDK